MNDKVETHHLLQGWAEEYEAREVFGAVGALLYFCLLTVLGILGLVAVLVLGALTLVLLPLAAVVAVAAMFASTSNWAKVGGAKPASLDPWLTE